MVAVFIHHSRDLTAPCRGEEILQPYQVSKASFRALSIELIHITEGRWKTFPPGSIFKQPSAWPLGPSVVQRPVIVIESDPQAGYIASNSKAGTDCATKQVHCDSRYVSSRWRWLAVADVYFLLTASEQSLQLFVYHRVLCQTFAFE